jgi:cytochrome c oxidase assembly protein subunit 15
MAFILVAFQGWLGSKVVSTDLKPLVISVHLVVALIIALALLGSLFFSSMPVDSKISRKSHFYLPTIVFLILGFQFFLGTEVRSQVDILFKQFDYGSRNLYVENLDRLFIIHRSSSLLVLGLMVYQLWKLGKGTQTRYFSYLALPLLMTIFLGISGAVLVYFDFPALVQPVHLLFGFSIICAQFWLLLLVNIFEKKPIVAG